MWKKFWQDGELPTIETTVGIDTGSIARLAIGLFLAGFLIILAYYSIKRAVK